MNERRAYVWWSAALGVGAVLGILLASPRFVNGWNDATPGLLHLDHDGSVQVGGSLVGGVVVAVSVLFLDRALTQRRNRSDLHLSLSIAPTLEGANLDSAYLRGAYLRNKNMRAARLDRADLSGAIMFGADLTDARLMGVNFEGAYLGEADLGRTMWNDLTRWTSPALRQWVLDRSTPDTNMKRYEVHGPAVVPVGIGVPPSDHRFDAAAGASPPPTSSSSTPTPLPPQLLTP